jgi:subfamily B ATP-binding cassette protein HlyB/CyaB
MAAICKRRTVIIIAHRLTAVRHAHRIIVVEQGRIAEQGSHSDLVNKVDGLYSRLFKMQQAS